jgi:hypothetical protein
VQDYLNGKKRTYRNKVESLAILQLRGYLICPKCSVILTGSASKGRSGKYCYTEPLLNRAVETLSSLDLIYERSDNKKKREIIGSIFPEKLVFDGLYYRTARLNEAVSLIYSIGKGFSENKKRQTEENFDLSNSVNRIGFEPMTLSLEG